MSMRGSNLPEFRSVQLDFAAHIRNPEINPRPHDVDQRRMKIYLDLFFNNIKNFIDSTFPVCAQVLGEERWTQLVREFVHKHGSQSPYFLQISEEFLTFLHERGLTDLPEFMLELCHYEWVELSLDVADPEPPPADQRLMPFESDTPLDMCLAINPVLRCLAYEYPVHKIGPDHQPTQRPSEATLLIAVRDASLRVRFIESNPVTHRLLELLQRGSIESALLALQDELQLAGRNIQWDALVDQGRVIIEQLCSSGIVLGVVLGADSGVVRTSG